MDEQCQLRQPPYNQAIVIPTSNRPQSLRRLLEHIQVSTGASSTVVLVVDDSTSYRDQLVVARTCQQLSRKARIPICRIDDISFDALARFLKREAALPQRLLEDVCKRPGSGVIDLGGTRNLGVIIASLLVRPDGLIVMVDDDMRLRKPCTWKSMLDNLQADGGAVHPCKIEGLADCSTLEAIEWWAETLGREPLRLRLTGYGHRQKAGGASSLPIPTANQLRVWLDSEDAADLLSYETLSMREMGGGAVSIGKRVVPNCMFPRLYNEDWMCFLHAKCQGIPVAIGKPVFSHQPPAGKLLSVRKLMYEEIGEMTYRAFASSGLNSFPASHSDWAKLRRASTSSWRAELSNLLAVAHTLGTAESHARKSQLSHRLWHDSMIAVSNVMAQIQKAGRSLIDSSVMAIGHDCHSWNTIWSKLSRSKVDPDIALWILSNRTR